MAPSADITCAICEEVYNLEERKPLLLACSHTFCRTCLLQLQSTNSELCPNCRGSWAGHDIDSLPVNQELVKSTDEIPTATTVQSTPNQNICDVHDDAIIAWCKICKVFICFRCLQEVHKSCECISLKEKSIELNCNLRETISCTRTKLTEEFTNIMTVNNSKSSAIKGHIKKLQHYEEILQSFAKKRSKRQEKAMKRLREYENIPSNSGVNEQTIAISETLSLLDESITAPSIPEIVVPDCQVPTDETDSEDEMQDKKAQADSLAASTSAKVALKL